MLFIAVFDLGKWEEGLVERRRRDSKKKARGDERGAPRAQQQSDCQTHDMHSRIEISQFRTIFFIQE